MALSLSNFLFLCYTVFTIRVQAAVRTYDFNIGWLNRNPDGMVERPVIGINGQWPIPRIDVDVGDRVVIHAHNNLGNESTSLHFHGIYQNGSTEMDGPIQVSQCEIPPGSSFLYNFTINQTGTYWYHSHSKAQYPDGLRGPLIVHDPSDPYEGKYDEELVVTLSDWYHDQMPGLLKWFISVANPTGAEPVPKSNLMNDTQNLTIQVEPNKTYKIRLINIGAFAGQYFWIQGHDFDIIEVDGITTERQKASQIYLSASQRYTILLTTKNETTSNYAIMASMDEDLFDTVPSSLNPNVTSYLVYDSSASLPRPYDTEAFDPYDDFYLVPYDRQELLTDPDQRIVLALSMNDLGNGANYAWFNNITYVQPTVPTLYSVLTSGELATDATIYGSYTNTFVLERGQIIEIVVNNHDTGKHPFHLHGHAFQAVARGVDESGDYDAENTTLSAIPMRRDTFMVQPDGYIVMRFRADNPGVWIFHCHLEWHLSSGLLATMVEAPLAIQEQITTLPQSHIDACQAASIPMVGNAAGHGSNLSSIDSTSSTFQSEKSAWFDLSGQPHPPKPLPSGFTAKGYVALVFSVIAALLGLASIVWYGLGEISEGEIRSAENVIKDAGIAPPREDE
ncbi:putative iron transport multicopper oxidase fet3 [Phaeomoniella chlamydospora]|uniref:Putative iron transport multicopper oxidase fet3 n=1 Tax=Phaeomoniella chlamydospora TaxID=158046 RepID=A0A0G2GT15_PHACM|nr:putative iron transport multicopper oxidase fet3 [Phaeomoniella chlamydospora]